MTRKAIEKLWLVAYLTANGIEPVLNELREMPDENGTTQKRTFFIFEMTPEFKIIEQQYYNDNDFRQLRLSYINLIKFVNQAKEDPT